MKIIQINSVPNGSTGKIAMQISEMASAQNNWTSYFFCGSWVKSDSEKVIFFGTKTENILSAILSRFSGFQNIFSFYGTLSLIRKLKEIKPDIIHLHNLHLWIVNIPLLMRYIKKNKIKTIWTLHDCWSFTGHCPHFDMVGCDKWRTECHNCPQYREYPKSLFDNSRFMYRLKKKWFTGIENMTLVTPSEWLAGLVKQSFLKDYPVLVINNGIDLGIFKPTSSNFKARYKCEEKHIVLGVAFGWGERKGLDVFCTLAQKLDKKKYQIVLVGTDDAVDKHLPENIISIHRTQNQIELAQIYTAADVFANPTREEVFGMVNVEALACGTPVVTFNTGGSPECIDNTSGCVVDKNDIDTMRKEIIRICETKPYSAESCLERSKNFDKDEKFQEYIKLYEVLNGEK